VSLDGSFATCLDWSVCGARATKETFTARYVTSEVIWLATMSGDGALKETFTARPFGV